MPDPLPQPATAERGVRALNGWWMLFFNIALFIFLIVFQAWTVTHAVEVSGAVLAVRIIAFVLMLVAAIFLLFGYFTLQPNEARVLILFGSYRGTARKSGFHWANPFYARNRGRLPPRSNRPGDGDQVKRIFVRVAPALMGYQSLSTKLSLRAQNFNSPTLKVNDKRGNPVEIAAVVVWRVDNTAQAVFDVEDYGSYVEVQSESAIRSIASRYAYDHSEEHEPTLRGGADEVSHALKEELQIRLARAGVAVEEARLTHLAYAPEIAPVMLRRQQAEAIIAARQIIVQNAVGMVHMALRELDEKAVVKLDDERKAAMVSNLLVVLCGSSEPSPVINAGTLYT
jgi:regulator of protease activity HflC (stomatin/prohibitin superfamily)